jgi:hypothetical protein
VWYGDLMLYALVGLLALTVVSLLYVVVRLLNAQNRDSVEGYRIAHEGMAAVVEATRQSNAEMMGMVREIVAPDTSAQNEGGGAVPVLPSEVIGEPFYDPTLDWLPDEARETVAMADADDVGLARALGIPAVDTPDMTGEQL